MSRKGGQLERTILKAMDYWRSKGAFCQQNHPQMLPNGTYIKKHGFDFLVWFNGKLSAFDAKECQDTKWYLTNAKPHQMDALLSVGKNGGESYFLVYFHPSQQAVKFKVSAIVNTSKSYLTQEEGEKWTIGTPLS